MLVEDKKLSAQPSARKMITIWSLLILGGVIAYGVGLYQGSQYRMQNRTIASEVLLISDSPNNTENPMSDSK